MSQQIARELEKLRAGSPRVSGEDACVQQNAPGRSAERRPERLRKLVGGACERHRGRNASGHLRRDRRSDEEREGARRVQVLDLAGRLDEETVSRAGVACPELELTTGRVDVGSEQSVVGGGERGVEVCPRAVGAAREIEIPTGLE